MPSLVVSWSPSKRNGYLRYDPWFHIDPNRCLCGVGFAPRNANIDLRGTCWRLQPDVALVGSALDQTQVALSQTRFGRNLRRLFADERVFLDHRDVFRRADDLPGRSGHDRERRMSAATSVRLVFGVTGK